MFTEQTSEHGEIGSEKRGYRNQNTLLGRRGTGGTMVPFPGDIDPDRRSKRVLLDSFGELGTEEQWSGD
jgi:hypothetical protein